MPSESTPRKPSTPSFEVDFGDTDRWPLEKQEMFQQILAQAVREKRALPEFDVLEAKLDAAVDALYTERETALQERLQSLTPEFRALLRRKTSGEPSKT